MNKKRFIFFGLVYLLSMTLNHLLTNNLMLISTVLAQEKCKTALKEAEQAFESKNWDEIIKLLSPCLPDSIQDEDTLRTVYELLSIAYAEKNKEIEAKKIIKELIKLYPEFKPRIDAPRKFKELVKEEKKLSLKRKRLKNMRRYIVGGAIIASVASVIAYYISKPPPPQPLPGPPKYPNDK